MEATVQSRFQLSLPLIFLSLCILLTNIANGVYIGLAIQRSAAFQYFGLMGQLWALGWWITDDNKKFGLTWVSNLEILLYFLNWIVIPVYLFRTRGWKAFLILGGFIVLYIWFYFLGVIIGILVKGL